MNKKEVSILSKLALKYKLGKRSKSYTDFYFELLKDKRRRTKKVLVVGIGNGANLKVWRDFFPNAKIYGADYRNDALINEDRIESILCDQRRKDHLDSLIAKIGPNIDLIIDNGSHRTRDQIFTCLTLMPQVKEDATYVVQDIADPLIKDRFPGYKVSLPKDNPGLLIIKKSNITFFAKPPFRVGYDRHWTRISSLIRGIQIAQNIGAKLNPTEGYKNDVVIYVKPPYRPGTYYHFNDFNFEGKRSYLDIVDELSYNELLKIHPEVGVITLSDWNYKIIKKMLPNHKVVNIPQQHCNFERLKRNSKKIAKVGIIGSPKAFDFLPNGLEKELKKRKIELVKFSDFSAREKILDFYMDIDVQIVWRPYFDYSKDILMNPLKIVNASSFGVPTIAYDEKAFAEVKECYIGVKDLEGFLAKLDELRDSKAKFNKIRAACIKKSEEYHIDRIAKMYEKL